MPTRPAPSGPIPLLLAAVFSAALAAGCANASLGSTRALAPAEVRDDPAAAGITVVGPALRHSAGLRNTHELRSRVDRRTGAVTHRVHVVVANNTGWRSYQRAALRDGAALPLTEVARDVRGCREGGCRYEEIVEVVLTDAQLRAAPDGLAVALHARTGAETVVTVTPAQVARQLEAVDRVRPARRP